MAESKFKRFEREIRRYPDVNYFMNSANMVLKHSTKFFKRREFPPTIIGMHKALVDQRVSKKISKI